jgi:hypothetical protein
MEEVKSREEIYQEAVAKCKIREGHFIIEDSFYTFFGEQEQDKLSFHSETRSSEEKFSEGPHKVLKSNCSLVKEGDIVCLHSTRPPVPIFLNPNVKSGYRALIVHEDNFVIHWDKDDFKEEFLLND